MCGFIQKPLTPSFSGIIEHRVLLQLPELFLPICWKSTNSFKLDQHATSSIKLPSIKDSPLFTLPYNILILFPIIFSCYYISDLIVFYLCLSYGSYLLHLTCIINLFTCLHFMQKRTFLRTKIVSTFELITFNTVFCAQMVFID